MKENKIVYGLIGFGGMGKWHTEILENVPEIELAGIYDIKEEKRKLAEEAGFHTYETEEAMLADESIDVILVATPNDTHRPIALRAMEAGKNVIVEKPATLSLNFHMSLEGTDLEQLAGKTEKLLEGRPERISTIGFYCNPIQYPEHRKTLEQVIRTAGRFGADHVSTFAGAFEDRPVEESFAEFGKVFRELADLAKENGVKLGIENCLMDGTWEKATCNIGFHPRAWEAMFEEVKQDNFGLEWEPTHQMVQLIDPVSQLRKWCHKIVHVHGKDATIDWNAVRHGGISGAETFVWHRMPGFGDTNWRDIISILRANGYEDDICIEGYHDPVYSGEWEMTGQLHALRYLKWCRGGDYEPVPWEV